MNSSRVAAIAGAAAYTVLATLNAGGYRYGASDQAFYLPAIESALDPALFPRDRALIGAQDPLLVFDEAVAWLATATGVSLPALFFFLYAVGLLVLFAGLVRLGRMLYSSTWTVAALVAVAALRHAIPESGVNTLEGYLHPRVVAFAIGTAALTLFLAGRSVAALALSLASGLFHPTTALWFIVGLSVATWVAEPRARRLLLAAGGVTAIAGLALLLQGPLSGRLVRMDYAWLAPLAVKSYLFPDRWRPGSWIVNLAYPIVIWLGFRARRRAGVASPREAGLVAGWLALAGIFAAALPFTIARVALAVQLQMARAFWLLDLLALAYLVWILGEAPRPWWLARINARTRRVALAVLLTVLAGTRGWYVTYVEHQERRLVRVDLPADEWTDVMRWAGRQPPDVHLLADPGHAWRYGVSARVAARRDVLLEEVKDAAIAIYSREVALRVVERTGAVGDFSRLTTGRAIALAERYELDYLIAEQTFDLPVAYRNTRFRVYRLR